MEDQDVAPYNSHVDQILELHEIPSDTTGECASEDQTCRRAYVKILSDVKEENVFRLTSTFEVEQVTDQLQARAYLGEIIDSEVTILNDTGGASFDIYYVSREKEETKLTGEPVITGGRVGYNSYVLNEFLMRETGACVNNDSCRSVLFVNPGGSPSKLTALNKFGVCVSSFLTFISSCVLKLFR